MAALVQGSSYIAASNSEHNGVALEKIADAIEDVNLARDQILNDGAEIGIYEQSRFDAGKDKTKFRQYDDACDKVKDFYKEQHGRQTVAYNRKAREDFHSQTRASMTIWEAIEKLNTLIDESDPDTDLSQITHLLQAAEAMRRDGKPRWMQLTGLIHFDDKIIFGNKSFAQNPDYDDPIFSDEHGIYEPGCGLDNVMLSWGHDEYLYHVVKDQSTLPDEALAMIRYHSFYPWHKERAYRWMMNEKDHMMLKAVNAFNPYDLYSKSDEEPSVEKLKPYYIELIHEYFPQEVVKW